MKGIAILCIRAYQWVIAPHLVQSCRFEPTCSQYAAQAIHMHGTWRGVRLAFRRISTCGPSDGVTYDPVPPVVE